MYPLHVEQSRIELASKPPIYTDINGLKFAKDVWEKLEKMFGGEGLVRRVQLMSQLVNTKLDNCKDMEDYVAKGISTVQKLNQINFTVADDWAATFLLASLPETYALIVMALQNIKMKLELEDLQVALKQRGADSDWKAEALVAGRKKPQGVECYTYHKQGHAWPRTERARVRTRTRWCVSIATNSDTNRSSVEMRATVENRRNSRSLCGSRNCLGVLM